MARKHKIVEGLKEAVRVSRRHEFVALDPKKHGVGGVIRGTKIRARRQDKSASSGEGYAVIFFPRVHGIGKACVHMFGLDRSLSSSPEAAISKFMDGIANSESWKQMSRAGHRVRKVRIIDLGDAPAIGRKWRGSMSEDQVLQIKVNGELHGIPRMPISYEAIARMAGRPNDRYLTVTYHAKLGDDMERNGILHPGKSIEPCPGLIFNAIRTGNA